MKIVEKVRENAGTIDDISMYFSSEITPYQCTNCRKIRLHMSFKHDLLSIVKMK